ncbi:MAG: ABC transporter permease [SAR202 cluster bacterium]|nr:ABC transporter permease [SAR202 cluster bacterium]
MVNENNNFENVGDGDSPAGRSSNLVGATASSIFRFLQSSPIGAVAVILLIFIVFVGLFPGLLAPYDPNKLFYSELKTPPSSEHWAGTDFLARDSLSRIFYGARITLMVAVTSVFIGDLLGFTWGVASGYLGRRFDLISQRLLDMFIAFPTIILALLILAALGAGLVTVIAAIALIRIPGTARVMRSVALSVKEAQYVEAASALGASPIRIMFRHVAPQCFAPLLVVASAGLGSAIFTEAALSFLGMGVPPPTPTWGNMLGGVLNELFQPPWWLVIYPGVAITITVLAFNLFGDALRDYLDPRLRGRLEERT